MAKMTPYRKLVAVTGTYEDRNGDEKKRYVQVGMMFQYEDGNFVLKLDSLPLGAPEWTGFVNCYELEERNDEPRQQRREEPRQREPEQRRGGGGGGFGGRGYDSRRTAGPKESFPADLDDEIPFVSREGLR